MKLDFREAPDAALNAEVRPFAHDAIINRIFVQFIPRVITPNQITILRFILTPFVFYLIISGRIGLGLILFILTALTDAIDGTMARMRKQVTRWGMVYDPVSDKLLVGGVMIILFVRHVNIYLASIIIFLESIYIISGLILKRRGIIKPAAFYGKTKMVLQCVGIGFILLGLWTNLPILNDIAQVILGVSIGFAIMSFYKHGFGL